MDTTNDLPAPADPPLTEEDIMIEMGWLELWHASSETGDADDDD